MLAFRASENVSARELECSLTRVAKHLQHCPTTMAGDDEVPLSGFKHREHRVAFHVPEIGLLESYGGQLTPGGSLLKLRLANSNRDAIRGAGPLAARSLGKSCPETFPAGCYRGTRGTVFRLFRGVRVIRELRPGT